jgi:hypothetical protein
MARVSKKIPAKPKAVTQRQPRQTPVPAKPAKKAVKPRPPAAGPKAAKPAKRVKTAKPVKAVKAAAPRRRAAKAPKSALPESYGTKRLFLVARDPRWLYAYWDFSRDEQRALNKLSATGRLSLRIYEATPTGKQVALSELHAESHHWFVPVGCGDTRYVAELGYRDKAGGWVSVALSNVVVTPPDLVAPEAPVMFATIPPDVPFREVLQTLGASVAQNVPLAEVIQQFQATPEQAAVAVFAPERQWTPRQALELARVIGPQRIHRRISGELSSLALARILPPGRFDAGEITGGPGARRPGESPSSPPGGWGGWSGGWSGDWS